MERIAQLDTHGARAVETFLHQGVRYLVVPQLAADVPGQPASMMLGNSEVDTLVFRWSAEAGFVLHQRLPAHGGEDAEHFRIGDRLFVAIAHLRSGAGPYDLRTTSDIYEMRGERLELFQRLGTYAAKQWKHGEIGGRHFLALAQGVALPGEPRVPAPSTVYAWNGERFEPFQEVESAWGYNWAFFEVAGQHFLAYADQAAPSQILRWDGARFAPFQALAQKTGRAFCRLRTRGEDWLAFACLHDQTVMLRWDGARFVEHQVLSGPGGREFEWIADAEGEDGRLMQVNFLLGTREAPQPRLDSVIHRLDARGRWAVVDSFPTSGGTDACSFRAGGHTYLVVANSLSADVRFSTPSHVYRL